ncbi:MAG: hypothetical protein LBI05_05025, partial [Planctomycetaceae bacterium]|nr:hypothetical protein [Planctomycetaceae bacterium]
AEAGRGSKEDIDAFARLGINVEKLQLLDKKGQFLVVAEAIKRLGDESLQTDAAMKIFGKGGTALLPMFQNGIEGIKDLMAEAEINGIGISDEDAEKAERLNDALNRMSRSFQGVRLAFTSTFVDSISGSLEWITKITKGLQDWIRNNQSLVRSLTAVGSGFAVLKAGSMGLGLLRGGFMALLPISMAAATSAQANATAVNSTTAAITAETQALAANTAAKRLNALASLDQKIGKFEGWKTGLQSRLGAVTAQKADWSGMLAGASRKEAVVIQREINALKMQEAVLNQKIAFTEQQISAVQAKRATFGRAVGITNYLNQMGLAQTATNRWAASVKMMSNAEAAAAGRSALAAKMTALTTIFTRQRQAVVAVTTATSASAAVRQAVTLATIRQTVVTNTCTAATNLMGLATKGAAAAFLALQASMAANPVMWIAGAVAALGGLIYLLARATEKATELKTAMSETREKGDKDRAFDEKKIQRLQQLQEKQKLTNEETAEAKKLTAELTGRYGDLGIAFEETAGKINLAADAMQRFMDAANANALRELQAEMDEVDKNISQIYKDRTYTGTGIAVNALPGMAREAGAWVTLGMGVDSNEEAWEKYNAETDKMVNEQNSKREEIRKKTSAIKGGENAIDVAKGEEALLDENLAKDQGVSAEKQRELEDAEKGIARIQRDRSREQRTAIENEIADLKDRNEEYKKFLKLLIETEQAKIANIPNEIAGLEKQLEKLKFEDKGNGLQLRENRTDEDDKKIQSLEEQIESLKNQAKPGEEKIANWQKELDGSDSALQKDMNRIRDKNKIDTEKFASMPMTMEISAIRNGLRIVVLYRNNE